MPTLRDISRRIGSVQKTQQITSAMRMVAAAKLRRAQDAIIAARPYSNAMYQTLGEIGKREKSLEHPLLEDHVQKRRFEVVVVTSDRGLCGAFNANAVKTAQQVINERSAEFEEVVVSCVGRKGRDHYRKRRELAFTLECGNSVEFSSAVEIADHLAARYTGGEIDEAVIIGNEFESALTQTPRTVPLLPFRPDAPEQEGEADEGDEPFEFEPHAKGLLDVLIPNAFEFTIYRMLLENQAGEHAARMTAMESATRNTEELIKSLTLQFNRARQAAITKELVEIVSGAEALK